MTEEREGEDSGMYMYEIGKSRGDKGREVSISEVTPEFFENGKRLIITDMDNFLKIAEIVKFPEKTVKEAMDIRQYPNAEFYDDLLFLTLNNLYWNSDEEKIFSKEVNLFLGRNYLLILHHGETETLKRMFEKIDHSDLHKALYSFLDAMLDNDKKMIAEVEDKALKIEDKILRQFHVEDNGNLKRVRNSKGKTELTLDQFMDQIVRLRKHLQILKRYIEPTADIIEILEADESDLIPAEYDKYFMKLSLKADRTTTQLVSLRDYIAQVRESWQANVDLNFNKIMKFFTVATTIFLPLTLITGWYGMNFQYMPELYWQMSYPIVFIVCVLIAGGGIWYFKRNNFI